jgi:predicted nucleic-acid-binding protein
MIAVDTNVVVRFLTNDEPRQARRAANLFHREEVLLPRTVLLECEWVLRHAYGIGREVIAEACPSLDGTGRSWPELPHVRRAG